MMEQDLKSWKSFIESYFVKRHLLVAVYYRLLHFLRKFSLQILCSKCSGYVSAFRKKDWKRCWPFVSDGDSDKLEEQTFALPSFHVPKFRFWRCENCLSEIGAKGTANSYEPVPKSCNTGFKSNSICSHARMLGDAAMISSNFQQAPKLDIDLDGRIDVNASANLNNTTEYHPSSCNDKEEKKTEVANGPIIGIHQPKFR